jgi:hypothetical protein
MVWYGIVLYCYVMFVLFDLYKALSYRIYYTVFERHEMRYVGHVEAAWTCYVTLLNGCLVLANFPALFEGKMVLFVTPTLFTFALYCSV